MNKDMYKKILIVEDIKSISNFIRRQIDAKLHFEAKCAYSFADTRKILESEDDFFVALLDLNLPDAPDGEVVDFVLAKKIPSIILTATFDEGIRDNILEKNVVDYVVKSGLHSLVHVIYLVQRIYRNQFIKVLIVDDSRSFRNYYQSLLVTHKFNVVLADDGQKALEVLKDNPDIKLVITDYNMPVMDGFELVTNIRNQYDKNEIAIIGVSAQESGILSAKFLKSGANDFLTKPFEKEEFYARVTQNIEMLEFIDELRDAAIRDPLTKLYNRRYYFDAGEKLFQKAKKNNIPMTIAMMDIDFFKKINDTYGHDGGDAVLCSISNLLKENVGEHILARFGGEEFCVLVYDTDQETALALFEDIRKKIEQNEIQHKDVTIKITMSIGVCNQVMDSLDEMINRSDEMLYHAKEDGRNQVQSS